VNCCRCQDVSSSAGQMRNHVSLNPGAICDGSQRNKIELFLSCVYCIFGSLCVCVCVCVSVRCDLRFSVHLFVNVLYTGLVSRRKLNNIYLFKPKQQQKQQFSTVPKTSESDICFDQIPRRQLFQHSGGVV